MRVVIIVVSIVVIVACVAGAYYLGGKRGFISGCKQGFADGLEASKVLKEFLPEGAKGKVEIIDLDDEPELKERLFNLSNKENEKNDEE